MTRILVPYHLDAHGDVQTLETTTSGYLGGIPLRILVGYRPELPADRLPDGPLYLHLDLDVVDPDQLPGLRFPASGGPGWPPVVEAARRVIGTGRVAALGVGCTWHGGRGAAERARPYLDSLLADWE